MLLKLTPARTGLIAGILIVGLSLAMYYVKESENMPLQLFSFIIYAAAIFTSLWLYLRSANFTGKFGDMFSQGFKTFIVVTLIWALFTGIFSAMHPEFAKDSGDALRTSLQKENNKTPAEIDKEVATLEKYYSVQLVSSSIFIPLAVGAAVTALFTVILNKRK